jgi:hypothetical protein
MPMNSMNSYALSQVQWLFSKATGDGEADEASMNSDSVRYRKAL